jgi:hypothetical protein
MQQGKMMLMIVVVTTLGALLVTMSVSTQNVQSNEGGSVEQVSTNTCDCPSNDIIIAIDMDSSEDEDG